MPLCHYIIVYQVYALLMHVTFGLNESSVDGFSCFVLPLQSSPGFGNVKMFGSGLIRVKMFGSGLIRVKIFNSGTITFLLTKPYLSNNITRLLHTHPDGPGGPGGPVDPGSPCRPSCPLSPGLPLEPVLP